MRIGSVATVFAIAALLAGCAEATDNVVQPGASSTPQAGAMALPSALVGQWSVAGAGVAEGTVLDLGRASNDVNPFRPGYVGLTLECGRVDGGWDGHRGGIFVAEITGGLGGCFEDVPADQEWTPGWLFDATRFAVDGSQRHLLNAEGSILATLSPDPRPRVSSTDVPEEAGAPTISPSDAVNFDAPATLPAGLRPARKAELLGVWVMPDPPRAGTRGPFLEFRDAREYRGSDGCNLFDGRWDVAGDGYLLITLGGMTEMGCENIVLFEGALAVGMVGEELVLVDKRGKETYRLVRESS